MSDNFEDRKAAGRSWVNFHGDYEPEYWSRKLGISDERLKKIAEKVASGDNAKWGMGNAELMPAMRRAEGSAPGPF